MEKFPKEPRKGITVENDKVPARGKMPYAKFPTWSFKRIDSAAWAITGYCADNCAARFFNHLRDYEGMTWQDIISANGGKSAGNGTNNHFVPVSKLCRAAQKRLEQMNIQEDEIFSLRLTGTHRVWGIIDDGLFSILWYDECHGICPSERK